MKDIKLLLVCGVLFGLTAGLGGCDVDDEEDCEAGDCTETDGGAGGQGGVGGGDPAEYRYVIIADDSTEENMAGTPGADICGIVANCGGDDFTATGATITAIGSGTVCDGTSMDAPCESGVNRGNASAALDTGDVCEPVSNPSDYVSLGLSGEIAILFNVDLTECNLTIRELEGNQNEPYSVFVCQTDTLDAATCLNAGNAIANSPAAGGELSVDVPAAD